MKQITKASSSQLPYIHELWEKSVRATHSFLSEEDIQFYKTMVVASLHEMELYVTVDEQQISGFLAIADDMIQALFVHPDFFRKGVGSRLLAFALEEKNLRRVDVNEQNLSAFEFYKRFGFEITGRSETDGSGRPYPILELSLPAKSL